MLSRLFNGSSQPTGQGSQTSSGGAGHTPEVVGVSNRAWLLERPRASTTRTKDDAEPGEKELLLGKKNALVQRAEASVKAELTRGLGTSQALLTLRRRKAKGDEDDELERQRLLYLQKAVEEDEASPSGGATEASPSALQSHSGHGLLSIELQLISAESAEDKIHIDVEATASLAQVKAKVCEVYGIPVKVQRFQLSPDPDAECFADEVPAAWASSLGKMFVVTCSEGEKEPKIGNFKEIEVLMEAQAAVHAVAESLKGVTYMIRVLRPKSAGGLAVELEVDALCLVSDLLAAVQVELVGMSPGAEPMALRAEGRELPSDLPLYFADVRDGDTLFLDVAKESTDSDAESVDAFDAGMQAWAARQPPMR